ncbi:uncharacterized protein F5Z01DRAFT_631660 [Emericellopsis atlantica]|uniref:PD-(D/E)XK nuclease-like domain-containing protein n=1 Tax=Emericellopsis atlantica TaxID=2614577 RepID=A0A9P8CJY2_9HYPO|nr:uncharacterized protein F5Z01DRAFT_631660 [Emericellopsis atlantica]KAG9249477.1 hypothetical protein F5Z01DRAFT_631660 [Emericellopsis atlantica]
MRDDCILRWVISIEAALQLDADVHVSEQPSKRVRLDQQHQSTGKDTNAGTTASDRATSRQHLPTPSVSTSPPSEKRREGSAQTSMSSSPSKRPRDAREQPQLAELDLTPRAQRTGYAIDDQDESIASTSSYVSSTKSLKLSRTSSPTKQIRHAELQQSGFRQASFATHPQPPSLMALRRKLKRIYDGDGILPQRLAHEIADLEIPDFYFRDDADTNDLRLPPRRFVQRTLGRADECDTNGKGESSWNMDVHARLLNWVLDEDSDGTGVLDSEYCLNAGLLPQYKPRDAPSKMVDFCLAIRPRLPEDLANVDAIRKQRPGDSINHTDWGTLSKHPIAISVETKRHGEQYDAALLQIATWHSAQWRSLRWGCRNLRAIEFLAGIIVQGHDWQFVASTLGENDIAVVLRPPLQLGDTRSEQGIYKLLVSLQRLRQWAEESYWPAFKSDLLGTPAISRDD